MKKAYQKLTGPTSHTFEDAEGLLQTLLLMSALLLSFVAGALLSFDKGTYIEMDRAELSIKYGDDFSFTKATNGEAFILKSLTILHNGMVCFFLQLLCSAMASATYVSLCFSDCREDAQSFSNWFKWFKWVIFFEYALFVAGVVSFFLTIRHFVSGLFPAYCIPTTTEVSLNNIGVTLSSIDNIFNATTKEIIEVSSEWLHSYLPGSMEVLGTKGPYMHKNGNVECSEAPKNIGFHWSYFGIICVISSFILIIIGGLAVGGKATKNDVHPAEKKSEQKNIVSLLEKQNALLQLLVERLPADTPSSLLQEKTS